MLEIDLGMFLLRVVVGLTFAYHGYKKAGSLGGTAGWFDSIGMKPGKLHAPLAAYTEIGSGLLLALGLFTPFACLAIVGVMAVAGWTVHRHAFLITSEGFEYTLIIATVAAAIGVVGPGAWSIDNAIDLSITGWAGLAIALGGGLAMAVGQLAIFFRPPAKA